MKKDFGNTINEYLIIIILVAIALVPIFFIFGQSIFDQFNFFYKCLKTPAAFSTNNSNGDNGDVKDKANDPVANCVKGVCSIDFGNIIINGIPEITETTGSSGGYGGPQTDLYANVLEQLANQLASTNPEGAAMVRALSEVSKNIASKEQLITQVGNKTYKSSSVLGFKYKGKSLSGAIETDLATFGVMGSNMYKNYWPKVIKSTALTKPSSNVNYDPKFDTDVLNGKKSVSDYLRENQKQDPSLFFGLWSKLNKDNKIPENMKNIINFNASEIANIASSVYLKYEIETKRRGLFKLDKETKEKINATIPPNAHTITDYKRQVICSVKNEC